MAGSFLLISKNHKKNNIDSLFTKIEQYLNKNLVDYFKDVNYYRPQSDCIVINFKKDNIKKFYQDGQNNWITYEGTVFGLNKTKIYTASNILNLYKDHSTNFVNYLDGHFVIKIYDATKQEFLIINDFIKNKTNYYTESEDFIIFSPILILTALIKRPMVDKKALNEFLWRYYILSNRTIFKDVNRLKPATIYIIQNRKIETEKYWDWPKSYTNLCFKDSVQKTVNSLQETARLISKLGKPVIDFTMGQDSRQIVSSFTSQGIEFSTSVFGKSDFCEVQNVKKMSNRHNIENYNITLNNDYQNNPYKYFLKSILLGSSEEPGYMLGRIMYMRNQQSKFGSLVLNGMDGHFYKNGLWDEMYTFNFYKEPKKFNIDTFLKMRALSNDYKSDIFNKKINQIKQESEQYFTNLVTRSIKDYINAPVSIQVDKFDLYHWLNFCIAANSACNTITNSISPLLLRRNLEFALKVPVQWKFNLSKYQRAIVYNMDQELAKEKTDFAGVNMVPKNIFTYFPFYFKYFYHQSNRLKNKIKSKLGLNVKTHIQDAWDYLPIYKNLFNNSELQLLIYYKNMHLNNIILQENWNNFVAKFQEPNQCTIADYEYILKIAGLEILLKEADKIYDL